MKHAQPEAVSIMKGMPGTHRLGRKFGEKATVIVQAFCDDAQISMINHHQPNMTIMERRRAEMVKAGKYHGQAIK